MAGAFLQQPDTTKLSEESQLSNFKFGGSQMQGWRVNMEDAHIAKFNIASDIHLFAVFDGHAGHEVAKFVEKHFESTLINNPAFKQQDYGKALYETFLAMDQLIASSQGQKELAQYQQNPTGGSIAGCTACVALIVKDKIFVANAGDSRCVVATRRGVFGLTKDHKPSDPVEQQRIEKAGGAIFEGRVNGNLNLTRAIGDMEFKCNNKLQHHEQLIIPNPDIRVWNISHDDEFLVLGCDGIWDNLEPHEVCQFISKELNNGKTPKQASENLLDFLITLEGKVGSGMDNMTCLVLTFK